MKIYIYTFKDGYYVLTAGLSAAEVKEREREHGKLVSKTKAV